MSCDRTTRWIWASAHPQEDPPPEVSAHLDLCESCRGERKARLALGRDLRALRTELEEEPSADLDARVLAAATTAVAAQQSGAFPVRADAPEPEELPSEIADEIAGAIAEDFGEQFAALTTGRLRTRPGAVPGTEAAPVAAAQKRWQAPRATPQWMVAASLLLAATLAVGIAAGRISTRVWPAPGGRVAATIAATSDGLILSQRQREHRVGLSHDGVAALAEGNTYLLAGPMGGPYEVVGVVTWGQSERVTLPMVDDGELVVAVGPAGGWSRGKELAMNDLADLDVEILGRRALPRSR